MIKFKKILKLTVSQRLVKILKLSYQLNLAVLLASHILEILKSYNLTIPEDKLDKYLKIDSALDNKDLLHVTQNGTIRKFSIGKFFKMLFPHLDSTTLQTLVMDIKLMSVDKLKNYIKLFKDDISGWYNRCDCYSCMKHEDDLLRFYDEEENISILVRFKNGEPYGRALLWKNVDADMGDYTVTYMDRVYPTNDQLNKLMFYRYAELHGYAYSGVYDTYEYSFTYLGGRLPYLDTFSWVDVLNKRLYSYNCDRKCRDTQNTEGTPLLNGWESIYLILYDMNIQELILTLSQYLDINLGYKIGYNESTFFTNNFYSASDLMVVLCKSLKYKTYKLNDRFVAYDNLLTDTLISFNDDYKDVIDLEYIAEILFQLGIEL